MDRSLTLPTRQRPPQRNHDELHIEGYPDAVRLVRLRTKKAQQLAHYIAHRADLDAARESLELMLRVHAPIHREILWSFAIISYIKCFRSAHGRAMLHADKIYDDPKAISAFQYFLGLRNKHVVHDENAYSEHVPAAAINDGSKSFKVERVLAISFSAVTLVDDNINNLRNLIGAALSWVSDRFEKIATDVTADLEKQDIKMLLNMEEVRYTPPTPEDVARNRTL